MDVPALSEASTHQGQTYRQAFFCIITALLSDFAMTQNYRKSREQAEISFGRTQTQLLARDRAVEELQSIVHARDVKTLRLREARLAKELQAAAALSSAPSQRTK
jgi:hypothetical protein